MQIEIEAKFLNVNHDVLRAKLQTCGARCQHPSRLMKRRNYDFPDGRLQQKDAWVRLRDEGDKVTLTYKQLDERSLQGMKEAGVGVASFEAAHALLLGMGLLQKSYQETKRESWLLANVQIELDEWPWIRPFIEIEGEDERAVKDTARRLGLDWTHALHGSVEIAYQAEFAVSEAEIDAWPEIVFSPVPDWLEPKRKEKAGAL